MNPKMLSAVIVAAIVAIGACVCASIYANAKRAESGQTSPRKIKKSPQGKAEIERVLWQDAAATQLHRSARAYAVALREIDFQKCPMDFQTAWLDFVQSAETVAARDADFIPFVWKSTVQTLAMSPGIAKTLSEAQAPREKMREAWYKVEHEAIKYGATIKINVGNPYE